MVLEVKAMGNNDHYHPNTQNDNSAILAPKQDNWPHTTIASYVPLIDYSSNSVQ